GGAGPGGRAGGTGRRRQHRPRRRPGGRRLGRTARSPRRRRPRQRRGRRPARGAGRRRRPARAPGGSYLRGGPPDQDDDPLLATLVAERPLLVGLAYRITGSRVEAEDIVQDAWLRA